MTTTDPYLDPESGILRNSLGITDGKELAAAEADITSARLTRLLERPIAGTWDLAHLQALHREVFGSIYPWAGQLRTVEIGKDTGFCPVQNIEGFAADIFRKLARADHLRGLDQGTFSAKAADLYGDVNALHPFREGNGRTQRAFLGQLATAAGYTISWSRMDPERNRLASIASYLGQEGPLRAMFADLVTPATSRAKEQPIAGPAVAAVQQLVERPPALNPGAPKPPTYRL
ncbi:MULTISPECIES: Fic family protein [Streptacidiphilus]|uniref:protein adenylyltransferase n=1 Tax=Streptacidiphilus cavernicola TaxID=3342716 RepID=A0ABV6V098_9ACTN|nr:Fic family protein [Streptacidiphilus jeojiense]